MTMPASFAGADSAAQPARNAAAPVMSVENKTRDDDLA
jgi:hypothetical protein